MVPDHLPIPVVEQTGSDYHPFPVVPHRPTPLKPVKLITHQPSTPPMVILRKPVATFYQWLADLIGERG